MRSTGFILGHRLPLGFFGAARISSYGQGRRTAVASRGSSGVHVRVNATPAQYIEMAAQHRHDRAQVFKMIVALVVLGFLLEHLWLAVLVGVFAFLAWYGQRLDRQRHTGSGNGKEG